MYFLWVGLDVETLNGSKIPHFLYVIYFVQLILYDFSYYVTNYKYIKFAYITTLVKNMKV